MKKAFLCLCLCLAVVALSSASRATAQDSSLQSPRIVVDSVGGLSRVSVEVATADGGLLRSVLRETAAAVAAGATGWDPTERAAFANWTENGQRFTSFSRDGGRTWAGARPIETALRLQAGATRPGDPMPAVPADLSVDGATAEVFLVQFRSSSLPEWRAALADLGAEVLAFFPHNAHLVRFDPSIAAQVAGLDIVERVEAYEPAYRLEAELLHWLSSGSGPAEQRVRVMAFEWGPAGKDRIATYATGLGARLAEYWPSGQILELWVDRPQLRSLAAHRDVLWIDRWTPAETDMDIVREDSGANWVEANVGVPGNCGQGVRAEVMDNGIDNDHMDFDGILMHTAATNDSHGSSTYGINFGNGDRDGDGDANATGHVPCAQGIFADYGSVSDRFAHTQELKAAPYFASYQSNSWGNARTTAYTSVSAEMDDIIFRLDIAILQSQSNAGNQQSRPQAWAKNIISVGGIRHYNTLDPSDDAWASGASIGPAADGRIKPDLNYWYDSIYTTTWNNSYTSGFGGTSAATPESAGVVGLMVQLWSDNVWGTDPVGGSVFERQPHASTIKALAINNAVQYPFTGTSSDLTRTHQGWGRPNVRVAYERAADSFVIDEDDVLTIGQTRSYTVYVSPGQSELKVTMVYKDPPGTTSSTLHRINDVDLKVSSPSATVYYGNVGLSAGNYSTPGGSPNGVDTVENVFVQNPESGAWTVEVTAAEVNQDGHLDTPGDDVVFALVVTGASGGTPECGNGVREGGEDCDGADLGGQTCSSQGCSGGTLACDGSCRFDYSACTGCPTCDDDGVCEPFEDCDSCPGDCREGSTAACGNGTCEIAEGENCQTCPADCNGKQGGKPSSRYCCGLDVDCSDSRCNGAGNLCDPSPAGRSCCGDGTCEGDEDSFNCEIDCGPPSSCGDGICSADEDCATCPADCPVLPEAGNCTDGLDNDCDGAIDCADSQCLTDPACSCLGSGQTCAANSDCCSGKCKGNGLCR